MLQQSDTFPNQIQTSALSVILSPDTLNRIVENRRHLLQKAELSPKKFAVALYEIINAKYVEKKNLEKKSGTRL